MSSVKRFLRKLPPKLKAVLAVLLTPPFLVCYFVCGGGQAVCEGVEGYWGSLRDLWEGRE